MGKHLKAGGMEWRLPEKKMGQILGVDTADPEEGGPSCRSE
jgi:hypothetical protein